MDSNEDAAIMLRHLHKSYGQVCALDGLSLAVPAGSVTGLLGPNGSGKTTTIGILSTTVRPDRGQALVCGLDVTASPAAIRRLIGFAGQFAAVDANLTGRENLRLIGRLSRLAQARRAGARRGASREVRPGRGGGPAGPRLLGRHAAAPRRRGRAHAPPAGAVPRRADDRPGPGEPGAAVAAGRRAGRRRHDGAADHAVPGGSRRPGRPRGDHRSRPGGRRGNPARAEEAGRVGRGAPGVRRCRYRGSRRAAARREGVRARTGWGGAAAGQ